MGRIRSIIVPGLIALALIFGPLGLSASAGAVSGSRTQASAVRVVHAVKRVWRKKLRQRDFLPDRHVYGTLVVTLHGSRVCAINRASKLNNGKPRQRGVFLYRQSGNAVREDMGRYRHYAGPVCMHVTEGEIIMAMAYINLPPRIYRGVHVGPQASAKERHRIPY